MTIALGYNLIRGSCYLLLLPPLPLLLLLLLLTDRPIDARCSQLLLLRGEAWFFCGQYGRALDQFTAAAVAGFETAATPAASKGCWGERQPLDRGLGAAVARALKYRALLFVWRGRFADAEADIRSAVNIFPEVAGGAALLRDMGRYRLPEGHPQHLAVSFPPAPSCMDFCGASEQASWQGREDSSSARDTAAQSQAERLVRL